MYAGWLAIAFAGAQEPAPAVVAAVTNVHHSEIDVVTPIPAAFAEPPPAYVKCAVRVQVDQGGVPVTTSVKGCEEPAASAASAAAMQGRWKLREGQVAPISFVVPVEGRPLVPGTKLQFQLVIGPERTLAMVGLGEVSCKMRMGITAQGVVDAVSVAEGCPEPLRAFLTTRVVDWQVVPWLVDGVAIPVVADLDYAINPGGVAQFHHSEIEVRRRTMPVYPEGARSLYPKGTAVDCRVRIFIDATGVPYEVRPEADCPNVFWQSAQDALIDWRWYPAKIEDQAVKAQFVLNIKYRLD